MQIATSLDAASEAIRISIALLKVFEGCRLKPYLCSAGVPTIGFGATHYEDGGRVTLHDKPIVVERAFALLVWMVRTKYLPAVRRLCPTLRSPEQLAAIISFTYNLGEGSLRSSTLRKRILAEDWDDVPYELRKWDKAGGRKIKGLTRRRDTEAACFMLG